MLGTVIARISGTATPGGVQRAVVDLDHVSTECPQSAKRIKKAT